MVICAGSMLLMPVLGNELYEHYTTISVFKYFLPARHGLLNPDTCAKESYLLRMSSVAGFTNQSTVVS